jgi:very-short-patch-repair endonuclease
MKKSNREIQFQNLWKILAPDFPEPETQHKFHSTRRWRFDFAWTDQRVAVEIDGGTFSRGKSGHTTGIGHHKDCEKFNAAQILGWRVLKYTSKHLDQQPAQIVDQIKELLQ